MVKKVDDNGNEVLRGAVEVDAVDEKYNLRTTIENESVNVTVNQEQLRDLIVTNKEILRVLMAMKTHLEVITNEEICH